MKREVNRPVYDCKVESVTGPGRLGGLQKVLGESQPLSLNFLPDKGEKKDESPAQGCSEGEHNEVHLYPR